MGEPTSPARPHAILCHVIQSGWSVTFTETDGQTRIGPWLLCNSHEDVLQILTWGHIEKDSLAMHHRNLARWSVGSGTLYLSTKERYQLVARGRVGRGMGTS